MLPRPPLIYPLLVMVGGGWLVLERHQFVARPRPQVQGPIQPLLHLSGMQIIGVEVTHRMAKPKQLPQRPTMSVDPLTPGRRQRFQWHQIHPDRRKSEAFQILTGALLGQIQV